MNPPRPDAPHSLLDAPPPEWAAEKLPDPEDEVVFRRILWVIGLLLAGGLIVVLARGGNSSPDPVLDATDARSHVPGFTELGFRVRPSAVRPDAERLARKQRCALFADKPEQRQQGLMGRKNLAGYDAMLFRFRDDQLAPFHMHTVKLPLSIAWFDRTGAFVSATNMKPCPKSAEQCPLYYARGAYRYALEVPKGKLGALGVGPGSRLTLAGVCHNPPPAPQKS